MSDNKLAAATVAMTREEEASASSSSSSLSSSTDDGNNKKNGSQPPTPQPSKFVYQHFHDRNDSGDDSANGDLNDPICDAQGNYLVQALPARIDLSISSEAYVQDLSFYLGQVIAAAADQNKKLTILVDVRPGEGWPNHSVLQLAGLIRQLANELHVQFPDALHKLVLFPIPRAAIVLYNMAIKPLFRGHPKLKQVMELVPGARLAVNAPAPLDKLSQFVALQHLETLEQHRLATFVKSNNTATSTTKQSERGSVTSTVTLATSTLLERN